MTRNLVRKGSNCRGVGKVGDLLFKRTSKERLNRVDPRSRSGLSEAKAQGLEQEGIREAVGEEQASFPYMYSRQ